MTPADTSSAHADPAPAPAFGEPCPIQPSLQTLDLLARRRSSSAQLMTVPGPSQEAVQTLLRLAARVPDHGKLAPWRFIVLRDQPKAGLVARLERIAAEQPDPGRARAALAKLSAPPVSVVVVSSPQPGGIPVWEQQLSAGAVCALFLVAAEAMGFGANWITDWYAYDPDATALLGLTPQERVAGFLHVGSVETPPLERVRPDLSTRVTVYAD